ncbi:MAG: helix-turn-helix transcriptional regulator [Ruminococcaceae bacterium]|nr:helix-turn-helix transcriptional regulator [Oscillospiraceae bacterium]
MEKRFALDGPYGFSRHIGVNGERRMSGHPWFEVFLVMGGTLDVQLSVGVHHCSAPAIVIIPPGALHCNRVVGERADYDRFALLFQPDFVDADVIAPIRSEGMVIPLDENAFAVMRFYFERLKQNNTLDFARMLTPVILTEALQFDCHAVPDVRGSRAYIDDVRRYLSENYDKKLLAEDVARQFGVSRTKLMCDFKQAHGMTVGDYLGLERMNHAIEMLTSGARVSDAAWRCGFESDAHFRRCFKAHTGLSPTEFKKKKEI